MCGIARQSFGAPDNLIETLIFYEHLSVADHLHLHLAYRRQNEESFLDALVQVFQYFGGVSKRVIFDNGQVAVKDGFGAYARKQVG